MIIGSCVFRYPQGSPSHLPRTLSSRHALELFLDCGGRSVLSRLSMQRYRLHAKNLHLGREQNLICRQITILCFGMELPGIGMCSWHPSFDNEAGPWLTHNCPGSGHFSVTRVQSGKPAYQQMRLSPPQPRQTSRRKCCH